MTCVYVSAYMNVCNLFTGTLNVFLRMGSFTSALDLLKWTKSGHQGPDWRRADFDISPSGPFQVRTSLLLQQQLDKKNKAKHIKINKSKLTSKMCFIADQPKFIFYFFPQGQY